MNSPLVSVVMPVYNGEKYISESIKCVIEQTYNFWELIIVDDGSTDNSATIAQHFASEKIKVISQENRGASTARNNGLSLAKGEFIQFLDADDLISLDKLSNQVTLALRNPGKLVLCSTIHFHTGQNLKLMEPNPYEDRFVYDTADPVEYLTHLWGGHDGKMSMIQTNAWLTPTEVIQNAGKWDETLTLDDDGEFFCRVLLNSKGIVKDALSLNYYRKFPEGKSLSGSKGHDALLSQFKAHESKKQQILARSISQPSRTALANLFLTLAVICFDKNKAIYQMAITEIATIGVKPNVKIIIGGKTLQFLVKVLGWKTAKKIQKLTRKLLKN